MIIIGFVLLYFGIAKEVLSRALFVIAFGCLLFQTSAIISSALGEETRCTLWSAVP